MQACKLSIQQNQDRINTVQKHINNAFIDKIASIQTAITSVSSFNIYSSSYFYIDCFN